MNSDIRPLFRSRQADGAAFAAPSSSASSRGSLPDPSPRLVNAFQAVAVRMAGLSFVNPALAVEAVGFAPWQGHWLGVMLTPWFMNLILAPRDIAAWQSLKQGGKRCYRFPAGEYDFIGAHDELAGEYQLCSLFSPVLQFEDQDTARLVAQLAREALFDAENAEKRCHAGGEPVAAAGSACCGSRAARKAAGQPRRAAIQARFPARPMDGRRPWSSRVN